MLVTQAVTETIPVSKRWSLSPAGTGRSTLLALILAVCLAMASSAGANTILTLSSGSNLYELDLDSGRQTLISSSPYTDSVNGLAVNEQNGLIYYGAGTRIYYWDPADGNGTTAHHLLNDFSTLPVQAPVTFIDSTGGTYLNGRYYVGSEDELGYITEIYEISLSSDGRSVTAVRALGLLQSCNCSHQQIGGFGDISARLEAGSVVLYGSTADISGIGLGTHAGRWKLDTVSGQWIWLNSAEGGQLGFDRDANLYTTVNQWIYQLDPASGQTYSTPTMQLTVLPYDLTSAWYVDFGDAPDSYGGAMHALGTTSSPVWLGQTGPDNEGGSLNQSGSQALGDDQSGTDDEDAFGQMPVLQPDAGSYQIAFGCHGQGAVSGWFDINRNGRFDATERNSNHPQTCEGGVVSLRWDDIGTQSAGSTYLRLRTASSANDISQPTGLAADGEVEDHIVDIGETGTSSCPAGTQSKTYTATDLPKTLGPHYGMVTTSVISVADQREVRDVNLLNVRGTHTYISDLVFDLVHDSTSVRLMAGVCGHYDNFDLGFDDEAALALPCPPTDQASHPPQQPLSAFDNRTAAGDWTLRIEDTYNYDGGELRNWVLELCLVVEKDYGDAPDPAAGTGVGNWQTLVADNGPSHALASALYLGSTVTADQDGFTDGIDTGGNAGDDVDDALTELPELSVGDTEWTIPAERLQLTNDTGVGAQLYGFFDANGDGDFDDTGESAYGLVAAGASNPVADLVFSGFAPIADDSLRILRLRLTSDSLNSATGPASDGEIEDWPVVPVHVIENQVISGTVFLDRNADGTLDGQDGVLADVVVALWHEESNLCIKTRSRPDGRWSLEAPAGEYQLFEAGDTDSGDCPPAPADPAGMASTTPNLRLLIIGEQPVDGLNFGDVSGPAWLTDNNTNADPGAVVALTHQFRATVDGVLTLSLLPLIDGLQSEFQSSLYIDSGCDGRLDGGDSAVQGELQVLADQTLCVINRVAIATQTPAGTRYQQQVQASYHIDHPQDDAPVLQDRQTRVDVIVVSGTNTENNGYLVLDKTVTNLTHGGIETVSNEAKPGDRLRYAIRFSNSGTGNVNDLHINDFTPAWSFLAESISCPTDLPQSLTGCSVTAPASGNTEGYSGALEWQFEGVLSPGASGELYVDVIVE